MRRLTHFTPPSSLLAQGLSVGAILALVLLTARLTYGQDSTSGAVRGLIKDRADKTYVSGATVVATSPALQGQQTVITDSSGTYYFTGLNPGIYEIVVYYADASFSRTNVLVRLGKVSKVNITIDSSQAGEKIVIQGRATIVDQDSTKTGTTITQDYTDNVPTGRTFGALLGTAAGSQADLYGVSFGGSTSVENTYIVEGVNTTDPGFGLQSTNLPNEFVRETEVITGGYEAEYGRSTGGIINVVTKSGSNEFHGSAFAYWTPGSLTAAQDFTPRAAAAIDFDTNLANNFDLGAEIGGPLIVDKLWFHVGVNPSFAFNDIARIVKRQVDTNNDGIPDVDKNGFGVFEELDRSGRENQTVQYYYTGKLTGALNQDHQGSLSILGSPSNNDFYIRAPGQESTNQFNINRNIADLAAKWSSKFNNSQSQLDLILGYHYDKIDQDHVIGSNNDVQYRYDTFRPLTDFADFEMADGNPVPEGCDDLAADDPYPNIINCPVRQYQLGGVGFVQDSQATRAVASMSFTQRIRVAGQHRLKVGLDIEEQSYRADRSFSGGRFLRDMGNFWRRRSFFTVRDGSEQPCGSDFDGDGIPEARCSQISGALEVNTKTRNYSAYLQDTWSVLPNLTINAGLRYEQQTLFTGDAIQGQLSPTTGEKIPEVAFKLGNMWAPRLGISYDWTQEGRSKVFAHYGRFYESIPMDINVRAYGGEVLNLRFISSCDTSGGLDAPTCDESAENSLLDLYLGGGDQLSDPDLKAQYLDEVVAGVEYEILPDFKLGANYVRRELGRVIEDISTDGGNTYVIANPGDVSHSGVADRRRQARDARASGNEARARFLDFSADQFENSTLFDRPNREYNALVIKADKRFSKSFFLTASYTYSNLSGNFPGLFSPETGQLDPNLTSMFDLPELMGNRFGNLAADRPHPIKLDGFYRALAEGIGSFTFGGRIRGTSGSPHQVLAAHAFYGFGESYLLPRGTETIYTDTNGNQRRYGRSPFTTQFDTHLAFKRRLSKGVGLEAFVDIFNLFNQQPEVGVDENYTFDNANPIIGGDSEDLMHLKRLRGNQAVTLNPNFGNTNARQAPLTMRLGMRLTF